MVAMLCIARHLFLHPGGLGMPYRQLSRKGVPRIDMCLYGNHSTKRQLTCNFSSISSLSLPPSRLEQALVAGSPTILTPAIRAAQPSFFALFLFFFFFGHSTSIMGAFFFIHPTFSGSQGANWAAKEQQARRNSRPLNTHEIPLFLDNGEKDLCSLPYALPLPGQVQEEGRDPRRAASLEKHITGAA